MNRFTTAAFCLTMATSVYSQTIPDEDVQFLLDMGAVKVEIEEEVTRRIKANCADASDTGGSMQNQILAWNVCKLSQRVNVLQFYIMDLLAERMERNR